MLAVRIALVFRGCEDFSWILIDSKCNNITNTFFHKNNLVQFGSFLINFAEHNASCFSFCAWKSKVGNRR